MVLSRALRSSLEPPAQARESKSNTPRYLTVRYRTHYKIRLIAM